MPNLNEAFPKKKGDGEEEEGAGKKPRPYFMRAIEEGLVKIDTTFPLFSAETGGGEEEAL